MCLLVVVSRVLAEWPLIVAANRDERYDRAASAVQLLRSDCPRTLGGRDLLAGGTWLAVNERGVVAGLTNLPTSTRDPTKRSRGEIPLMLTSGGSAAEGAASFVSAAVAEDYNPCWVLVGDRARLFSIEVTGSGPVSRLELPPGVHVLENTPLGNPSTKVAHVRDRLRDAGRRSGDELLVLLQEVISDHTVTRPVTEPGRQAAQRSLGSACCVHSDGYGTRSSMLIRVPRSGSQEPEVLASDGPCCTRALMRATFDA